MGSPALLELAPGLDGEFNAASWVPFNLSFNPYQGFDLVNGERGVKWRMLKQIEGVHELEPDLSAEPVCHEVECSVWWYKGYCSVIFKAGQTHTSDGESEISKLIKDKRILRVQERNSDMRTYWWNLMSSRSMALPFVVLPWASNRTLSFNPSLHSGMPLHFKTSWELRYFADIIFLIRCPIMIYAH